MSVPVMLLGVERFILEAKAHIAELRFRVAWSYPALFSGVVSVGAGVTEIRNYLSTGLGTERIVKNSGRD